MVYIEQASLVLDDPAQGIRTFGGIKVERWLDQRKLIESTGLDGVTRKGHIPIYFEAHVDLRKSNPDFRNYASQFLDGAPTSGGYNNITLRGLMSQPNGTSKPIVCRMGTLQPLKSSNTAVIIFQPQLL